MWVSSAYVVVVEDPAYQLDASKATALFVGEEAQTEGIQAAEKAGMAKDHVIVMQTPKTCQAKGALKGGDRRVQQNAWAVSCQREIEACLSA